MVLSEPLPRCSSVDCSVRLRTLPLSTSSAFVCSPSLIEPALCYSYFVLRTKGGRASQAKTLHGIQSLARDCDAPLPTADLPPKFWKTRWLLWLEDTSTDESRRAAAALRKRQAMLTN